VAASPRDDATDERCEEIVRKVEGMQAVVRKPETLQVCREPHGLRRVLSDVAWASPYPACNLKTK
jgi:hypothetical protein